MFGKKSSKPKSPPTDDATRLRDALVLVLTQVGETTSPTQRKRIEKVVGRLARLPSPTGLLREMSELAPKLAPTPPPDDSFAFGEAADAMGKAIAAVAIVETEMQQAVQGFRKTIPQRITGSDANRIRRRADAITNMAGPIRARASEARTATAELVQSLVKSIGRASGNSTNMDGHVEALANTVVELQDVEGMEKLRRRMEQHVDGIRMEVACLKRDLNEAKRTTSTLTDRLVPPRPQGDQRNPEGDAPWAPSVRAFLEQADRDSRTVSVIAVQITDYRQIVTTQGDDLTARICTSFASRMAKHQRPEDGLIDLGSGQWALVVFDTPQDDADTLARQVSAELSSVAFTPGNARFNAAVSAQACQATPSESASAIVRRALPDTVREVAAK